jgi:CRP/FNR family transcriptional regulator, cyclic AMP receptor protein
MGTVGAKSSHTTIEQGRQLLADCVLFRGLTPAERKILVGRARLRKFQAGETILMMGGPGDSMMAVLDGSVRISVPSPEGKEIVLTIMQPGEFFGEIAVLDGKERTADATALTACSLAILDRRDIVAFLDQNPNAWSSLVEVLCERLRRTTIQIAEVALMELPIRLAKALLRMASAERDPLSGQPRYQIQLSQRELGNIVGATRESVNKCLREWQRTGMVQIEGVSIKIMDRAALQMLANAGER